MVKYKLQKTTKSSVIKYLSKKKLFRKDVGKNEVLADETSRQRSIS